MRRIRWKVSDDAAFKSARRTEKVLKEVHMKSTPQLNPDGVSVKGCTIIYAPTGQAGEYAALATNPYRGCGHQC
jgi:hypothetical protein